jgi:hypothetical protein
MLTAAATSILPGPRTRDTKGEKHRRAPRSDESGARVWLNWKAYGRDRGLKPHVVNPDGSIIEMHNPAPEPRRKPKAVSSRQWGRC